jgi:hypothetical protein
MFYLSQHNFEDISDLENIKSITISTYIQQSIHPIFVALFGVKLIAIEDTYISGDLLRMHKSIYTDEPLHPRDISLYRHKCIMSANTKNISNSFATSEHQKIIIQQYLRHIIVRIRSGDLYIQNDYLSHYNTLKKLIYGVTPKNPPNTIFNYAEDKFLTNVINSIDIYCHMLENNNFPLININSNLCTGGHLDIRSLEFEIDKSALGYSNKIELKIRPSSESTSKTNFDNFMNSLILNGTVMFSVNRITLHNYFQTKQPDCRTTSYSNKTIEMPTHFMNHNERYVLKSVVGYFYDDDVLMESYFCILWTKKGPWYYTNVNSMEGYQRISSIIASNKNKNKENGDCEDEEEEEEERYARLKNYTSLKFSDLLIPEEEATELCNTRGLYFFYSIENPSRILDM